MRVVEPLSRHFGYRVNKRSHRLDGGSRRRGRCGDGWIAVVKPRVWADDLF